MALDLLFGNSHTGTYLRGHEAAVAAGSADSDLYRMPLEAERYQPLVDLTPDGRVFNPIAIRDLLAKIDELRPDCLITAVLGSQHWILGMAHHPRPFDFVVPALPRHPAAPDLELVPLDLLVRRWRHDLDWEFGLIRAVQANCRLPILHIEAPPPVADADLMMRHMQQFQPAVEAMRAHGMPSAGFRFKVWWVWTWLARQICAELGVRFVAGPAGTRDAAGFLSERYFGDGVHGSVAYGELMVREVVLSKQRLGVGAVHA